MDYILPYERFDGMVFIGMHFSSTPRTYAEHAR